MIRLIERIKTFYYSKNRNANWLAFGISLVPAICAAIVFLLLDASDKILSLFYEGDFIGIVITTFFSLFFTTMDFAKSGLELMQSQGLEEEKKSFNTKVNFFLIILLVFGLVNCILFTIIRCGDIQQETGFWVSSLAIVFTLLAIVAIDLFIDFWWKRERNEQFGDF